MKDISPTLKDTGSMRFISRQLRTINAPLSIFSRLSVIAKSPFKLFLMTLILGSYYGVIREELAGALLIFFYIGSAALLLSYVVSLGYFNVGGFKWKLLSKTFKKELKNYWILGILNSLGLILAYKIDIFIIGSTIDNVSVGYYSTFLFSQKVTQFRIVH